MATITIADLNPRYLTQSENALVDCASNELDALYGGRGVKAGRFLPGFTYQSGSNHKTINVRGGGLLNPTFSYHRRGNTRQVSFRFDV